MPWKVKVKVACPFGYMSLNRRNGSDAYKPFNCDLSEETC